MRINKKNKKKIIIASVLGGMATIFIFSSMSSKNANMDKMNKMLQDQQAAMEQLKQNPLAGQEAAVTKVNVVIAGQDIKVGDTLTLEMLKIKECTEEDAPEGFFKTAALVVGKKAGKNLVRGQYVTTTELMSDDLATIEIPNDMRAISIPVEKFKGIASHIRVGSSVDILKVANPPEYIAQNIRVVAFESSAAAAASRYAAGAPKTNVVNQAATQASAITFLVPLDIVPRLLDNMFSGELQLIARNNTDQKTVIAEKELPPPPSDTLSMKLPELNLPTEPSRTEKKEEAIAPPSIPKPEPKKIEFIKASAISTIEFNDEETQSSGDKANASSSGDLSKLKDLMNLVQ